jgi:predicted Zn-dependent protease with MMP-like domain
MSQRVSGIRAWQADRVRMSIEEFEEAVGDALDAVPAELMDLLDNVVFLLEEEPPAEDPDLLGVYDGTPLTERGGAWAAGSLPDRITIFRGPLERMCVSREELLEEIAVTVVHEIAHHFGIDDERLHELGWD